MTVKCKYLTNKNILKQKKQVTVQTIVKTDEI